MSPSLLLAQAAASAPADDIRDIRPLVAIPSPWEWIRWIVLGGVLLALAWVGWEIWRKRRKKAVPADPLDVALADLEKARSLLAPETTREFSIAVSQVVRAYIETRFADVGARAAHRTTEEFLHDLMQGADSPLAPYRDLLGEFLRHCDLAKFGRWSLSTAEMEAMLQSARGFLLDTRPQPKPAAAVAAPVPPAAPVQP